MQTSDRAAARALPQGSLGGIGCGWGIGTFGAPAEFHHVAGAPPPSAPAPPPSAPPASAPPAPASAPPYLGADYLRKLSPGALRGKRIGLWLTGTGVENVPAVARVMTETTVALTRLGATVVPAELPYLDQIGGPPVAPPPEAAPTETADAPTEAREAELASGDVVADVRSELMARVDAAIAAGVDPAALVLDPGLGFAKSAAPNWTLLNRLPELLELGFPLLIGAPRQRFLGLVRRAGRRDRRDRHAALPPEHLRGDGHPGCGLRDPSVAAERLRVQHGRFDRPHRLHRRRVCRLPEAGPGGRGRDRDRGRRGAARGVEQ